MKSNKHERTINGYTLSYHEENGLYYTDLDLPEQTHYPIGKYGQMRLDFIKKHRRGTYVTLLTEGNLNKYLHDIDEQAREQVRIVTKQLTRSRGISEETKSADQIRWVREMNNAKHDAEEIIITEMIYN